MRGLYECLTHLFVSTVREHGYLCTECFRKLDGVVSETRMNQDKVIWKDNEKTHTRVHRYQQHQPANLA